MALAHSFTIVRRPGLGWLISLASRCRALALGIHYRVEARHTLSRMSAREARDIGLTVWELEAACNRPIWQDPNEGLERAARDRSGH